MHTHSGRMYTVNKPGGIQPNKAALLMVQICIGPIIIIIIIKPTWWPKSKPLTRITESYKTVSEDINFDYKMSTKILQICIKYSMFDLICDSIRCCVCCDIGKINVYNEIVIVSPENMDIK